MEHKTDINMYKGLASYILPDGVLDYFDVVDFAEEPTPEDRLYRNILHLYLDERDNRPSSMSSASLTALARNAAYWTFPYVTAKPYCMSAAEDGQLLKVTTISFRLKT